ncbi:MAG TPA: phage tail protein [Flavobacteriales bacterium]|nr:phage tail protein [Flavobacteriales bacterium]HMR26975.1 phage tail protein [Flavobacteriales bacterium]
MADHRAQLTDPYTSFKFRVKFDGRVVAGVHTVSALGRGTGGVAVRDGGLPSTVRRSSVRAEHATITLERGVTHDPGFVQWMGQVWNTGTNPGTDLRKDITLELYNEAGQVVNTYTVLTCWVSEYQALPVLDASTTAVAFERIRLENEGWEIVRP